jgi:acyl-CoA synthetase (AMP-forming)/AMP-acid ligase II
MNAAIPLPPIPFRNLRHLLSVQAKAAPRHPFIISYRQGERHELSYGECNARAHQTANLLQDDCGIQPGMRVALVTNHAPDAAVILLACWLIGAVVRIVRRDDPVERVDLLLAPSAFLDAHPGIPALELGTPSGRHPHFYELVKALPNTYFADSAEPTLQTPALEVVDPRSKMLRSLRMHTLLNAAYGLAFAQGITGQQRIAAHYSPTPLHVTENFLLPLVTGGTLVTGIDNGHAPWEGIVREGVHVVFGMPGAEFGPAPGETVFGGSIRQQDVVRALRHIVVPGMPSSAASYDRYLKRYGFPLLTGLPFHRVGGYVTLLPIDLTPDQQRHWLFAHGDVCVGCALPGVELAVLDAADHLLPPKTSGRLAVRHEGAWVQSGYEGYWLADEHERAFYLIQRISSSEDSL